jgi:phosphomevalonate kinase
MTAGRSYCAPGKLVVLGEYAVLRGGQALVVAIDRGVCCRFEPPVDGTSGTVDIETPDGDSRFVSPALEGAAPGRYTFSSWNPVTLDDPAHKPGFGGSAAACVAACLAAGRSPSDAYEIHQRVQGSGSGIDIAASIHGGALRFRVGANGVETQPASVDLPLVLWSGRSARTGPRVDAFLAWADNNPVDLRGFVAASDTLVDLYPSEPVAVLQAASELLDATLRRAGVDYLSDGLRAIAATARRHRGAAKPSGAGGGDCALASFSSPRDADEFARECAALGYQTIPCAIAAGATEVDRA